MSDFSEFLEDYIFYGADPTGLTDNHTEVLRDLYYFDDDIVAPPVDQIVWKQPPNDVRRTKGTAGASSGQYEEERRKTVQEIKDSIIYAMRDSLKMSTQEFVWLYNPTWPASPKREVLRVLDEGVMTEFGETDLDWAITLVAFTYGLSIPSEILYPPGKAVLWNIFGKRKPPWDQYCNPAEVHAMMMANAMIFGYRKFHEFFPQYISEARDPNYTSLYFKVLTSLYGKN